MNRRGFLAMMDAMIFMMVIMVAASALLLPMADDGDGSDASEMLDGILSTEVRMSDLVEDGDGSKVRLSDLIALHMVSGCDGVEDYLTELMEAYSGGRGCTLTLRFGDLETVIGNGSGMPSVSAERSVPVTTGGQLTAKLELFSS